MWALLNAFTVCFTGSQVRPQSSKKISKSATEQGRVIYEHFYKVSSPWEHSSKVIGPNNKKKLQQNGVVLKKKKGSNRRVKLAYQLV